MSKIKVLIVDDEPLARRGIRQLLAAESDFVIVGEAANGRAARSAIEKSRPEVVFLDVQMPLVDGFSLVETLAAANPPHVVFVTAYDEHALRAFDAGAVDYLLKPIDPERFCKTLQRVRERIGSESTVAIDQRLTRLLRDLEVAKADNAPPYPERFAVKDAGRISLVEVGEIEWIASEGNYVQLHTKGKTHLLRETMDGIERRLDPRRFLRLRRSTIVCIARIKELQPLFNGESVVVLKDNTKLTSSRRYRHNLDRLLNR